MLPPWRLMVIREWQHTPTEWPPERLRKRPLYRPIRISLSKSTASGSQRSAMRPRTRPCGGCACRRGEFVALVGPSGCGKTTTLNIAAGLDPDFKGRIRLPTAPGRSRPVLGYMFQNPRLLPWRTVYQNLALVLDGSPDADARIAVLLEAVGLTAVRDQYPGRLSVGMA